jgi:hypothetical protein
MTSPRNEGKRTVKKDNATTNNNTKTSPKGSQKKFRFPSIGGFKLRPMEIVAVGLLLLAIIVYLFSRSNREPETRPIEQLADSTQLQAKAAKLRPLYVIVDSLKLRSHPKLDSNFIRYLNYDELIFDMGEQTETFQTIRYSADEVRTEPWVKIRTEAGEVGWVFGAGVGFYRKKRRAVNPNNNISTITVPSTSANVSTATTPSATTTLPSAATTATRPSAVTTTRPSAVTTTRPSAVTTTRPSNR